jgi:Zn-dependent peptidase ImmA (M78 family)
MAFEKEGRIRLDRAGVPVLDAADVEQRAQEVIRAFDSTLLAAPRSIPVEEFVRYLADAGKLIYEPNADIGELLGKCWFRPPRIQISAQLDGPWRRFVLAHEFGHFDLHTHLEIRRVDYVEDDRTSVSENLTRHGVVLPLFKST